MKNSQVTAAKRHFIGRHIAVPAHDPDAAENREPDDEKQTRAVQLPRALKSTDYPISLQHRLLIHRRLFPIEAYDSPTLRAPSAHVADQTILASPTDV